ncbi:heme-binding protein [Rhizorhabdus wittichii]|uniref:Heme-binding protein n=1 Tax=Rhizorhabdus wittichii TaxID=160791 RepID=A0A975D7Z4_9SPHN|nr:heme-binding protein [Rhizorhabdus wittichii]
MTVADVQKVLAQAIEEAAARNKPAVIAIVDRVGNVLAVYQMTGAPTTLTIKTTHRVVTPTDVEGLVVAGSPAANPLAAAAIAKAITGAYLSSSGNAFSTRTASFIVQEHYPPGNNQLAGGPLFGVQFSQLPCSDFSRRYLPAGGSAAFIGPKRSPLGLAADPGGFPLYKNGVVVGGIGVMSDGLYGYDPNVDDIDSDDDEYIATAGLSGFDAPQDVRANNIQVIVQLRYTDADTSRLRTNPANARAFSALSGTGSLVSIPGYYAQGSTPAVLAGHAYGTEASGYRAVTAAERSSGNAIDNVDAFVLTDGAGNNRYPLRGGTDAAEVSTPLTQAEVKAILEEAFKVMSRARAQIRKPLDSRAQVTMTVVDTRGVVLGMVRGPDAPIFGTDVSLQKARTATFFSGAHAAPDLLGDTSPDVQSFVQKVRTFLNDPSALTGTYAFADRSGGNLSRPFFPDGEVGRPNGPLSRPFNQWSPFSTGLQSALIFNNLAEHLGFVLGASPTDTRQRCTFLPDVPGTTENRLQNGMQIFPGSVPVYRGNKLIGGVGVSGDGIDQDDMISFLGLHNGGERVTTVSNAPKDIRADNIIVAVGAGVRLRFVNCPFAPFLDTSDQDVCGGK